MDSVHTTGARRYVYFSGYTLDEAGVRMWPLRRYMARWVDLTDAQVRRADGQHAHYLFVLRFSTRAKPVKVRIGAGIGNLREFVQVFRWIRQAAPHPSEQHRGLFEEFMSTVDAATAERLSAEHPSDDERLARARVWWLALHPKRALRDCTVLMRDRSPLDVDAALLAIDVNLALGRPEDSVAVLEDIRARHPEHPKVLLRGAVLLLDLDDVRGEPLAEQVIFAHPGDAPMVGLHWAWYHFRARRWSDAAAVLDRVEGRARPLAPEFAEEFTRVRGEIAACRASPSRGLRQTMGRRGLSLLLQVGIPMLILALMAWPLFQLGPTFYAESRKLALLESRGVRVDAEHVRGVRRYDVRETDLSELSFAFSPDPATAEPWEVGDLWMLDRASRDAYLDRLMAGRPPRGWHRGRALLYDRTANAIESDAALRFVTYLSDDPRINTIGPITPTRVWWTWLAGGKAAFMAVVAAGLMVYLGVLVLRDVLRRRAGARRTIR